jgi:ABC-2 type transport system ATP-binding protein
MKTKLEVRSVSKDFRSSWTYKRKRGINEVSFSVSEGECFALLGANGAGKTTTIKCILGFLKPHKGEVYLDGLLLDHSKMRSSIGFLPEQPYFYQHLSVKETLAFYASLFGLSSKEKNTRVAYVMERLQIEHKARDRLGSLSKGQQQRVGLAQVLINDPSLLILDEPFSGLDPLARIEIRDLLLELKNKGKSIMISSHILSDIETLSDRAMILSKGEVKAETCIADLALQIEGSYKILLAEDDNISEAVIHSLCQECSESPCTVTKLSGVWSVEVDTNSVARDLLLRFLQNEMHVLEFTRMHRPLEDLFISVSRTWETL